MILIINVNARTAAVPFQWNNIHILIRLYLIVSSNWTYNIIEATTKRQTEEGHTPTTHKSNSIIQKNRKTKKFQHQQVNQKEQENSYVKIVICVAERVEILSK